ncbi:malignant fibrous histiocytoma-amplified sequence 1 homolog [Euwallacea similis]|uniref:malignant fibrous histiocytoma-amplified sequence 1 homolog n=1 Tax=Euwallacea similis TaxID=1736056 RepID=UPI00344E68C7
MGYDDLSKYHITLNRYEKELVIKSLKQSEENTAKCIEKYQLSSLFSMLEDWKFGHMQQSLYNITCLDLSHCDLTTLPNALKFLRLNNLNLAHNQLNAVPSCLYGGGLQSLQILDLSFNMITQFDVEPDCISTLRVLRLNNNLFENVPIWFLTFRCPALEEFNYSENKAKHFNFLKHSCNFNVMCLKKLELVSACLVGRDAEWLRMFKKLQFLDISNHESLCRRTINKFRYFNDFFIKPLWDDLYVLKLMHLDMTFFPEGIFWIESLKELNVSNNLLTWFPLGIEYLVNLEVLNVSFNNVIELPQGISKLRKLRVLIASHNHLDNVPLMPQSLNTLDLYNNYLETMQLMHFSHTELLDLEANFVCLSDVNIICEKYYLQRDKFRSIYQCKNRINGLSIKVRERYFSPQSTDSETEEESVSDENVNTLESSLSSENWDLEYEVSRNGKITDISWSDDEYTGENSVEIKKPGFNMYCNEEDWIFVDAD